MVRNIWVRLAAGFVAAASVVSACGSGESSSTEGSVRTKNSALGVQPVACVVGGDGPGGGIVIKVGATPADESIEISRDSITIPSGTPADGLKRVVAFADNLSRTTKPGWFVPDLDTLRANLALIQQFKGNESFWSSTPIADLVWALRPGSRDLLINANFIGLYVGVALRRFVEQNEPCMPPVTTTTVAPTTTLPLTCAAGGLCAVGDAGPAGGRIFLVNRANDGSSTYLEVAPADWVGASPSSSLVGSRGVVVAPKSTADGAKALAASYRGGGKSDWRLPDVAELTAVCRSVNNTLASGGAIWATDSSKAAGLSVIGVSNGCLTSSVGATDQAVVRPVRTNAVSAAVRQAAVDYYAVNPTTTTTTTTTLPPTTTSSTTTTTSTTTTSTTTASTTPTTIRPTQASAAPTTTVTPIPLCSNLQNCVIGQRGPGGGIIIEKRGSAALPGYLEVAPGGWDKGGHDPIVSASAAAASASSYRGGGFADWRLPTSVEIELVCKFATRQLAVTGAACPATTGKIDPSFGDGTGDRGASFYWHGAQPIRDRMDFASVRRSQDDEAMSYVRPVRTWTFVPAATTTTRPAATTIAPKPCAAGGPCNIGDVSPTGGLIVDFSGSGVSMTYTELAPREWQKTVDARSMGEPVQTLTDTKSRVTAFAQRTSSPWKLPTDREMRAAFLFFANNPTFGADCSAKFSSWRNLTIEQLPFRLNASSYWLEASGRVNKFDNFNMASGAAYYDVAAESKFYGRPFAERPYRGGGNPKPATWPRVSTGCATRTIPTTTTTTVFVNCAGGGSCKIGDIGPSRGVIIGIKRGATAGDVTYTEMEIAPTDRYDCQNSAFGSNCDGGGYDDFVRTRGLGGVFDDYPTVAELQTVARSTALKSRLRLLPGWYFSSTYRVSAMVTGDVNADSLEELGQSLEVNDLTLGVAVNMNGTKAETKEASFGFFRGVNIWKCRYSCR